MKQKIRKRKRRVLSILQRISGTWNEFFKELTVKPHFIDVYICCILRSAILSNIGH